MSEREHHFKDADGTDVWFKPSADHPDAAAVVSLYSETCIVPAHRLAEFTRALYAAAGQPVPDLPVIYDPATVAGLAKDLAGWFEAGMNDEEFARALLDAGWRKP